MYFQFQHPDRGELQRDQFIWSLSSIPLLEGYLHVLDGDPLKDVVEALIHRYKTSVIPKRRGFRRCECHVHALGSHMLPPLSRLLSQIHLPCEITPIP